LAGNADDGAPLPFGDARTSLRFAPGSRAYAIASGSVIALAGAAAGAAAVSGCATALDVLSVVAEMRSASAPLR
jgi:hypothetical protein